MQQVQSAFAHPSLAYATSVAFPYGLKKTVAKPLQENLCNLLVVLLVVVVDVLPLRAIALPLRAIYLEACCTAAAEKLQTGCKGDIGMSITCRCGDAAAEQLLASPLVQLLAHRSISEIVGLQPTLRQQTAAKPGTSQPPEMQQEQRQNQRQEQLR